MVRGFGFGRRVWFLVMGRVDYFLVGFLWKEVMIDYVNENI